jgi:translation initiation factor 2 subunit 3
MDLQCQPNINIGIIGHVADGKTTFVETLSGIDTRKFAKEQTRNCTIQLGYANVKIYKCPECPQPSCYKSCKSSIFKLECETCQKDMILVKHISFIDCPGHYTLMNTMLNGAAVMDSAILIESVANDPYPAQQTMEHLAAIEISGLQCYFACLNKLDLAKRDIAKSKLHSLQEYLKDTASSGIPLVPIVATTGINFDVVCQYLVEQIPKPTRKRDGNGRMTIIRTFNINRQRIPIDELIGGVLGGSITEGHFKIGQTIMIVPGKISSDKQSYRPIKCSIESIQSDVNSIEIAGPGGLIAIQTTLDPALTTQDRLVGQIAIDPSDVDNYSVYTRLDMSYRMIKLDLHKYKFAVNDVIKINHNASNIVANIINIDKKNKMITVIILPSSKPICARLDDVVSISKSTATGDRLVAMCIIKSGIEITRAH